MSTNSSLRRYAFSALVATTEDGKYANLAIKNAASALPHEQAMWVSALFYNTLDNLIYIDRVIDENIHSKTDKKIRAVLRLGVCQLLFMNVPESAAVNESVKLAKEIGKGALSGYVNGVLRSIARKKNSPITLPSSSRERMALKYSFPRYIVDMFADEYGEEFTEAMLAHKHRGVILRLVHPFSADMLDFDFRPTILKNAVEMDNGFDIANDKLFLDGNITIQSLSSMLVCHALSLKEGMRVLDACAAPGGKTAYISELLHNTGEIIATELHEHRLDLTKRTLARLHVKNARVELGDASKPVERFVESFDAVLVDAPCSGLGVTGKADIKYTKSAGMIKELACLQYDILKNCANYVKPDGVLVYSTCTISKLENEDNVLKFLNEDQRFRLESLSELLPNVMRDRTKKGYIQLFPHVDGMEGFFIARFKRI